jgi:hypothetical protein
LTAPTTTRAAVAISPSTASFGQAVASERAGGSFVQATNVGNGSFASVSSPLGHFRLPSDTHRESRCARPAA